MGQGSHVVREVLFGSRGDSEGSERGWARCCEADPAAAAPRPPRAGRLGLPAAGGRGGSSRLRRPQPRGRRSREVGAGAKEAETGGGATARGAPRRGAAWSCRGGSARCGRCSLAPAAAAAGTRRPRVSVAPRAGTVTEGRRGERPRDGRGRRGAEGHDGHGRPDLSLPGGEPRGGGAFRIPGGDGGAGGRRLAAALPSRHAVGKSRRV